MCTRTRPLPAALCAAAGLVIATAPALRVPATGKPSLSAIELALSALCISAALTLGALCAALLMRRPLGDTLGLASGRLGAASVAALVAGTLGISHVIDWSFQRLGIREESLLEAIDGALLGAEGQTLLLGIAGLAIAPGIGEEILFRGLLMRSLARRLGAAGGIALSAALFGMLHVDLVQGCGAALLGLYLGAVAFASGSIRTSVLCHVANNLTAALTAAGGGGRVDWDPGPTLLLALGVVGALAGLATLAGTLPAALRTWKRTERADDEMPLK